MKKSMSQFVRPDLSKFPVFQYGRAFLRIEDEIVRDMQPLRCALASAQNSVHFAWFSKADAKLMHCREEREQDLREGFFRAALTELVSIEEILKLDLSALGISKSPLKLNHTSNPLLHLFRELRNHEIHIQHSLLSTKDKDVLWGNIGRPSEATPLCISIFSLGGVTIKSFSQLDNARHYTPTEIQCLVDWFNKSQAEWGIQDLLLTAVEEYCRELMHSYLSGSP